MKKKISIDQIKRYFQKKYLIINKKKQNKENSIGSIARTLLASLLIISFFSISPILIEFKKILQLPLWIMERIRNVGKVKRAATRR